MNTYKAVSNQIKQWKDKGKSKRFIVVSAANLCIGWPYVYGGRGELCTPKNRNERADAKNPTIVSKCQVLNGDKSTCDKCVWYPGDNVLFFDCRGFTYWLFKQIGITINGKGATSQYDDNSNWSEKGPIENMPHDKVCCVFRYDDYTKKMEHTLLYDGEGNYIHCSGTVKKVKTSKYKATHYAIPKGMESEVGPMPEPEITAVVYSENGKPVKMRAKPNTSCKTYWEIPCGTEVFVIKPGDEWTQIRTNDHSGYMMSKFLKAHGEGEDKQDPVSELLAVYIPNITKDQADELINKYPGAYMVAG